MSGCGALPAQQQRCGTAVLLGWTNVGKSTLFNRLVGERLAAVAAAAQTTRHAIRGVCHMAGAGQVVFVDTPGLHRPRHRMNRAMLDLVHQTLGGADVAVLVIDAHRGPGAGDHEAAELLRTRGTERLVVLNKVDCVRPKTRLLPMMRSAVEEWGFPEVLPLSAHTGEGCALLVERVLARLPVGEPAYPADYLTDQTERMLAAEWIREQLLARTRQELPHATAVLIERWHERDDGLVEIEATILVERDSQKQIVIGRGGALLRDAGTVARGELERLLGRRVFLRLWVRTRLDWRDDEGVLRRLGLA